MDKRYSLAYMRKRGCEKKRQYSTKAHAELRVEWMRNERSLPDDERLHAYKCNFCKKFHVGHARDKFKEE